MTEQKNIYAVLRASGRPMDLSRAKGFGSDTLENGPYLAILDQIALEQQSAGSNHDSASQLFLNGKCVVESGLSTLAWRHQDDKRAASKAASDAVRELHSPDWLPIDETKEGFGGHQVAQWRVEKIK